LTKILNDEQQFIEESRSTALLLMGEMAIKNYKVVEDDINIAINTFNHLRTRVAELEDLGQTAIRNDFIANNYIESLNRFRDCYEANLGETTKRNIILNFVLNLLNKEANANPEIIYLLFLYLSRLDQGQFNSSVLLHSIILKDHIDIKIKKEA
jgi:hypothetical protein